VSKEGVEIVHNAVAEFDRAGIEGALEYFDPGIEWVSPPEWPEDPRYHGYDGLRKLAAVWTENFEEFRLDLERAIDVGNHVIALLHQRGRIKGSSSRIEVQIAWDCVLVERRLAWVRGYFSWEEALAAVGLEQ
jgi:ketosteroid isomerase-like protein